MHAAASAPVNVRGRVLTGCMQTPIDHLAQALAPPEHAAAAAHPLDDLVFWLERVELQQRGLDATRMALLAGALDVATSAGAGGSDELAYRAMRAELATALNVSEHVAETQLSLAFDLRDRYARTYEALERGEISLAHARVIVDAGAAVGAGVDPESIEHRGRYEAAVLDSAVVETPNRLRPIARALAEQYANESIDERHGEARIRRRVTVVEQCDGMADLIAYLPAVEAYAIRDRLTRIARAIEARREHPEHRRESAYGEEAAYGEGSARGEGPARGEGSARRGGSARGEARSSSGRPSAEARKRTRDEIRADALSDLLLAGDVTGLLAGCGTEAVQATVQIVVPAGAFMDRPGTPGALGTPGAPGRGSLHAAPGEIRASGTVSELVGYGPIDADSAGGLAALAEYWERVSVDPGSGAVLSVDRYRPSASMRRLLGARDAHCRFPGCRVPASRCDIDHTIDAALGGPTSTDNLAALCRGHHVLKHQTDWKVSQGPGGLMRWVSPTGRRYVDRPPGRVRFVEA